jgi:glycosyltransferase involved in cell wall biosynthesis
VYCNRFDLLVSPSTGLLGQMRGFGIRAPTEVIYNPVETGAMQAALDASAAQPAPGSDSGFVVLYVGRLAPEKNLPLLIRAFALLRQRHPSTVLWLAGDGISRASLEALVSELGLRGGVTFLGFVEHSALGGLYARSHVLVLPSTLEVQGLVAVEAMRFGKPIVLSDRIAAARELVVPGENGFIVPSDDPRELARRLEELAADPGRCRAMGEASLRRSRLYDVGEGIDRLEAAYRLLLGSSDPPAASSAASRGPA